MTWSHNTMNWNVIGGATLAAGITSQVGTLTLACSPGSRELNLHCLHVETVKKEFPSERQMWLAEVSRVELTGYRHQDSAVLVSGK